MTKQSNQTNPRGFRTLAALLPFLRPYKKQFVLAIFSLILAASATLAVPLSFRQIIDLGFNANSDNQINQTFLILFIVACLVALGTSLRFYMVSWLGEKITTDIRAAVYSHVIKQSPEFFESTHSGEILSRLNTDTVLIQTLIGTSVSMAIRNILLLAGGLVMMAAQYLLTWSYEAADATFVQPFDDLKLISNILIYGLLFQYWPSGNIWLGVVMIMAASGYLAWRRP